ncbi:MAG: CoA transferase [Alphaproteobacteria bacterium]|nr:CoA transferase [Alphaproteobacteria bacterium]
MSFQPASTALQRFTVLDLTRVRSGPTCVRQLADWGANVIKIEMPEAGEGGNPADFAARHDPDFQNLHRNKRSITLNLKSPRGIEVMKRLVERADVLVENYRPDVKTRLGIDYDALKTVNPRLVYTSISGFGQDGPYVDRPGVDQIAQGLGGLMSITGEPGRGPMRVGIPIADLTAGLFAAIGTLTALLERERSGVGQWVHTSLLEAQIFMLDFQAARWLMNQDLPAQVGNDHPTGVPTGRFKTKDGYINIAPTPAMWKRFCTAMKLDIFDHPDFATPLARRENRARINEIIEAITVARTSADWIDVLNEAGIPCGPIYSIDQTFADPQVRHLGIARTVTSAALGPITINGQPVTLSRTGSSLAVAAPEMGEHSDQILAWLGYSPADIATLRAEKTL